MRTARRVVAMMGMALATAACGGSKATVVESAPKPAKPPAAPVAPPVVPEIASVQLPVWVGWPADPAALQAAIDKRDTKPLREHAWRLWAGINQPAVPGTTQPLWWRWPTTSQLFEAPVASKETSILGHRHVARQRHLRARAAPLKAVAGALDHTDECYAAGKGQIFFPSPMYVIPKATVERFGLDPQCAKPEYFSANSDACSLKDGAHFQSNGDIMVATESFSTEGARAIESLGYNQGSTLRKLLDTGTKVIPGLPARFVDTKHMYWPIKAQGLSALPTYRDIDRKNWCQYNGYETWTALVAVDPTAKAPKRGAVDFLFGVYDTLGNELIATKHQEADVYPLDHFYAQRIDKQAWDALDPKDQMLLDAACQWAHGKPFEPDDYVITVAMHITTKEIPQWTFQSVWWSDQADDGPYAADRPSLPEAVGPWQKYLMTIEYGIPNAVPSTPKTLPIAFNPFIELAATHPVATNCRNCHVRAGVISSPYLADPGPGPLADINFEAPIFNGLLMTDTSWVIADRVVVPPAP